MGEQTEQAFNFQFYNIDTGEQIYELESLYPPVIEYPLCVDQDMKFELDAQFDMKLLDIEVGALPCSMTVSGYRTKIVQVRKHRQKRINKKWLKRYGYKEINVPFELPLTFDKVIMNPNGVFTFEGAL